MLFAGAPAIAALTTAITAPTAHACLSAVTAATTTAAISAGHQRSEFLVLRWQVVLKTEIMAWVGEGVGRS